MGVFPTPCLSIIVAESILSFNSFVVQDRLSASDIPRDVNWRFCMIVVYANRVACGCKQILPPQHTRRKTLHFQL